MLHVLAYIALLGQVQQKSIVGDWLSWCAIDGQITAKGPDDPETELSFKADGTFRWHVRSSAVLGLSEDGDGKYRLLPGKVILDGFAVSTMDTSHGKDSHRRAIHEVYKFVNGRLWEKDPKATVQWVFGRVGAGMPPLPDELKAKYAPSDLQAMQIVLRVESKYRSMKSYSDSGTVRSNGSDSQPSHAGSIRFTFLIRDSSSKCMPAFADQLLGARAANHGCMSQPSAGRSNGRWPNPFER